MLSRRGDHAAAEPVFRAVIAAHRGLMGDLHPHTMLMCGNLAQCLANQHRYDEAKAIYDRTAESMRNVHGPMHPDTQEYSRRAKIVQSAPEASFRSGHLAGRAPQKCAVGACRR